MTAKLPPQASCPTFARGFIQSVVVSDLWTLFDGYEQFLALTPIPDIELDAHSDQVRLSPDGTLAVHWRFGWGNDALRAPDITPGMSRFRVYTLRDRAQIFEHTEASTAYRFGFTPDSRSVWWVDDRYERRVLPLR